MRQYIGARYVPTFMGTYDATQAYEALSVVDNGMGTSYISKIPTPAGTSLTDTTYWAVYGATSGAIINLQNQIDQINNVDLPGINSNLNTLNNTTIPTIENDIDNIEASIIDVTEGPKYTTGSTDISDHAIHAVANVTLPAQGRYIMIFKVDFDFPSNESGVTHSLEMEINTQPTITSFGQVRSTYAGQEFTTNGNDTVVSLILPIHVTPASEITYYLHVRDRSTGASIIAYPWINSTNFA